MMAQSLFLERSGVVGISGHSSPEPFDMFLLVVVHVAETGGDWRPDTRGETGLAGDGTTKACADGRLPAKDTATARPANAAAAAPTVGRWTIVLQL
jgi:hypothetical protein